MWPVYSGRGSNFTTALDSLLPGQPVTFQLEVWSSPTADIDPRQEQSDTYTFYVPEKKHCGNRNDLEIYRNAKALDMGGKIETCVKAIFSNRDQKIKCIVDALGMSEGCAGCWADETQCIENNCIMPCLGTSQDKCNACINKYCMPAVAECAGLPEWALNISLIVK